MSMSAESGSSFPRQSHGLDPVARLAAHDQAVVLEHCAQVEADDRFVLGDQHPQRPPIAPALAHRGSPFAQQKKPPGATAPEGITALPRHRTAPDATSG